MGGGAFFNMCFHAHATQQINSYLPVIEDSLIFVQLSHWVWPHQIGLEAETLVSHYHIGGHLGGPRQQLGFWKYRWLPFHGLLQLACSPDTTVIHTTITANINKKKLQVCVH